MKIIFHIDINAFFISCELNNHPELQNKPIAISGKFAQYNKGVITTASYEARAYGVKSAMPVFQAKKLCPSLIILTSNMALYIGYSRKFINILKQYTPLVEVGSIDEAYLDVSDHCHNIHPLELAKTIQSRIKAELNLPTSIGVAPNKFLAKMASDMLKPMGITVLRRRDVESKLWPLDISSMYMIGKKTAPKLKAVGINTIGDIVKSPERAKEILGNQFEQFYLNAKGFGVTVVEPDKNDSYKSIGNSLTYHEIIVTDAKAYEKLRELLKIVVERLEEKGYLTKTITVQIKYTDQKSYSKGMTLKKYTRSYEELFFHMINLFDDLWNKNPIRLLGVSTSNLVIEKEIAPQYDLFNYEEHIEDELIVKLMNKINRKYGKALIRKGKGNNK